MHCFLIHTLGCAALSASGGGGGAPTSAAALSGTTVSVLAVRFVLVFCACAAADVVVVVAEAVVAAGAAEVAAFRGGPPLLPRSMLRFCPCGAAGGGCSSGGATAGAAAGADEGCCGGRGFASRSRTAVFAARSNPSCCHHCTIRESRVSTSASIRAACRGAQGVRRCGGRCGSRGWPRVRIPVGGWGEKEREGEWEGEGEGRLVLIRAEFDEGMPERGIQLLHAQQAEDERDCVPASLLNPVRANLLVRMRGAGTRMSGAERTGKALGRGSPTRLVRGGCQRAVGPCCRGETPRPLRSGTLAAG